jgi:TPP-dependent pyruvate/acetoin dehydrogenase alpha subunit
MMTAQSLIEFESGIRELWERGQLPSLVHLCGGNEQQLIDIFSEIKKGDWIFASHRTHYAALLSGIKPEVLRQKILDGDSMFVYSRKHNFLCSAVLAGCCGIAAGVAWDIKQNLKWIEFKSHGADKKVECVLCGKRIGHQDVAKGSHAAWHKTNPQRVWCFIGDGGEEEGHFYEAAMFVEANDLLCTFIIEDNNRSVDTPRDHRRGAAKGLEHLFKCVKRYHYTPTYPHAGSGCSFKIEFCKEATERHKRR